MITEVSRCQSETAKESMIANNNEEYEFMALGPRPCDVCKGLDGQIFRVRDMEPGRNAPPMHPYCHCGTAPHWDEEKYQRWLDSGAARDGVAFGEFEANDQERERSYGYIQDDGKREAGHVNLDLVNTAEYHKRYSNLSRHKAVNESLYSEAMEILGNRNNTEFEEIVAIDSRTGARLAKNVDAVQAGVKHACGFSGTELEILSAVEGTFETLHNHPSSSIPSRDDIVKLFQREKQSASNVCGHNGNVFRLEKLKNVMGVEELAKMFYSDCKEKYLHLGIDAVERKCSMNLIETLERMNALKYTERS